MNIKTILAFSSSIEFVTGLALIAAPNLVAGVLLSTSLTPAGCAVGRVGGFGLLCLAIACWPGGDVAHTQPIRALFLYNLLAACYLGYVRFGGEFDGNILLLAAVLHGVLAVLFARSAYETVTSKSSAR
jgi:hypothetical protein